ncbi:hypothetical protein HHK36_012361 [Tetracentron sinense]|uniref:Putative GTP diphosphokinase RSH1, chloroplastic n=1 Tax=Tetracentron sinense TaxID=13715 RepID=A0A834ZF79_TETSI|nr:hypothetical protein HHK36_012361 [Tetracentron sinense]
MLFSLVLPPKFGESCITLIELSVNQVTEVRTYFYVPRVHQMTFTATPPPDICSIRVLEGIERLQVNCFMRKFKDILSRIRLIAVCCHREDFFDPASLIQLKLSVLFVLRSLVQVDEISLVRCFVREMASAPSMSVSVECVNLCKLSKGDGSGRYECSVLSCAWKAPRALTGFLASTAHPPQASLLPDGRTGRRIRSKFSSCRCKASDMGDWYSIEAADSALSARPFRSNLLHDASRRWQLCFSSSSSELSGEISPETLWEAMEKALALSSAPTIDNPSFLPNSTHCFTITKDLKPTISYLPPKELQLVHNALKLAFEAHDGQKRRSGEPFIIHPVEVARILGELELDWESIAAGLLHDTVEDTNVVTFERIEKEFGATVRRIVEGETKVSKLGKLQCKNANISVQDVKADDLRQMFLAMTEEVRVIIVKLADRLHNMRTLSHMPPHKQSSIALETLQVFAPLAKLLGMYQIKSELENLSFMYTNAHDYAKIKRRVAGLYKEHEKELVEAKKILMEKIEDDQFLDLMTVKTEVRSVCKEPYSCMLIVTFDVIILDQLWTFYFVASNVPFVNELQMISGYNRKVQRIAFYGVFTYIMHCSIYKSVLKSKGSINEVNQIAQLRIIIKPKRCIGIGPLCSAQQICYHVLGLVHGIWTPIPRAVCILPSLPFLEFLIILRVEIIINSFRNIDLTLQQMKDYIATPKPNGYQSLHTTVIPFLYESMFRLEVQVRTEEMDLIAERGIAAHYSGRVFVTGLVGHIMHNGRNSRGKTVCLNNANISLRIGWLNAIREWQEEFVGNMSSREFVDTITRDLLGSRVFVFTPKGEIKNLPKGATVIDYAYMIHTEIGNKMVAAKVNGNLVSPMHVLTNAEVVEIITYNALSSKSAYQRHQQWLQHAKTRSARHKIIKFLREQAVLSATEITADTVKNFVADSEDESELEEFPDYPQESKPMWKEILMNVAELSTSKRSNEDVLHFQNSRVGIPKVNGKHSRHVQHMSLKAKGEFLSQGNGIAKMVHANIPMYKEVLPSLESWQAGKVASWHNLEGHSIQWFCVVCIDRRGMMADVTSALTAVGVGICSCVAEIDKRGMGVMLFHIEGNLERLVNACSSVDLILGVLGWSVGCSWPSSTENDHFLEC